MRKAAGNPMSRLSPGVLPIVNLVDKMEQLRF